MLINQDAGRRQFKGSSIEKNYCRFFFWLCVGFISLAQSLLYADTDNDLNNSFQFADVEESIDVTQGVERCWKKKSKKPRLVYYLYVADFIQSFIDIPASPLSPGTTTTTGQSYLAGRAPLYDEQNRKVGICSASFLSIQNAEDIFTNISNYISVDNGLIVSWFTPTRPLNLLADSILHSMVTECIVVASTKIGVNPFYGMTFNLVVSSENDKIYFIFTRL